MYCAVVALALVTGCARPAAFRVMSLRPDGVQHTSAGEHTGGALLITTIRNGAPDVVGLQDVSPETVRRILSALPDYGCIASSDTDNAPILYRAERFDVVQTRRRRLSSAWATAANAPVEHVVVWARLRFCDAPQTELQVVNVRFDPDRRPSRDESTRRIRKVVAELGDGPVIVLGGVTCPGTLGRFRILTNTPPPPPPNERSALLARGGAGASPGAAGALFQAYAGRAAGREPSWMLLGDPLELADVDNRASTGPLVVTVRFRRPQSGYT